MAQESLNLPYLTLSGVVFLAIIVSFLVYKGQIEERQAARTEIVALSARLQEQQAFLTSIDEKGAQLRANAAQEQELSVILPAHESFDDVLRVIDRQAGAAAVQVRRINNTTANSQTNIRVAQALGKETSTPNALVIHSASLTVVGSYQQLRQFISLMENAARFMDIASLSLTQPPNQPDVMEGSISAEFYSLSATNNNP
jgi:Tfp pilus assembly protein PilO